MPFPNKISGFVSTCVTSDNSFLSVRQEPTFGPWKGSPFLQQNYHGSDSGSGDFKTCQQVLWQCSHQEAKSKSSPLGYTLTLVIRLNNKSISDATWILSIRHKETDFHLALSWNMDSKLWMTMWEFQLLWRYHTEQKQENTERDAWKASAVRVLPAQGQQVNEKLLDNSGPSHCAVPRRRNHSRIVVVYSLSHGLFPDRLLCTWDYPGKNTGVSCYFLLQEIFPTQA